MELFSFQFLFPSFCHSIIYRVVCIIIIIIIWEFLTPALADGFLLVSEWQQVFLSV